MNGISKNGFAAEFLKAAVIFMAGGFIYGAIENGLVDIDEVQRRIDKRKCQILTMDDFQNIFKNMNKENEEFIRDKYGHLRTADGLYVISRRRNAKY